MTRNEFKLEAAYDILETLEYGYNESIYDIVDEVFNKDDYVCYNSVARKWFDEYEESVFDVIAEVVNYEKDMCGDIWTDISNPCEVLNMFHYIIGCEVMNEIEEYVDDDFYNECDDFSLTNENNEKLQYFVNNYINSLIGTN